RSLARFAVLGVLPAARAELPQRHAVRIVALVLLGMIGALAAGGARQRDQDAVGLLRHLFSSSASRRPGGGGRPRTLEPTSGFEPLTYRLQGGCSAGLSYPGVPISLPGAAGGGVIAPPSDQRNAQQRGGRHRPVQRTARLELGLAGYGDVDGADFPETGGEDA